MSREWKPGDVGITGNMYGVERPELFLVDGELGAPRFVYADGSVMNLPPREDARPLVVIDPEDEHSRAAIEITQAIGTAMNHQPGADLSHIGRAVNGALRSLVSPPKPDEPTGLGAVVEDAEGRKWVRGDHDAVSWTSPDGWRTWQEINAVRVLSEGVS